ncbi:BppU family phage baseplate upper protein [Clostridium thermobutyricum]|uniref:BppU N-terminal domain-containing protein n=1 Tax=Clostridium thermobutyricum DSM 4928 TaxID=1121339 RepID=A0A1V4SW76_9CLOT|nr:BppU family phage baseplate upper protein [Clostridium thermobutyricum]OPX48503.1 hypothetical protein CLTHE_11820 [Clostridium thermobutyricum DSM 4928]
MKYIVNKTINIDKNEITSIKAVENDMKTRFINFQLLANNQPLDLTGLTVRVYGKTSKGTEVFNDLNIIDSTKGLVELGLTRPFLVAGITEYQLKIYTSDNGVLSSNILQIDVTKDLMSNNSIETSNEYTSIEKAFQQVDDSINKINSAIVDVKANQIGGTNLLDNTDLANPIQMFNNTPNIQLIVDKTFQRQTSIYNEKLIGLQSAGDSFGDTYTSLFKTNDKIIQPDTTYTISFNYMSLHAAGDISSSCFLYFNKNDGTQEVVYMDVDLASHGENWFKYVKTFTTPTDIKNIEVRFGFRCTAFAWLAIDGVKLEKGTMATDWSPNPLDWRNEVGNGVNLISSSNCILTADRIAFPTRLKPNTMYTLNMGNIKYDGACLNVYRTSDDYTKNETKPLQTILDWENIRGIYTFETNSLIPDNEDLYFVFWGGGINDKYPNSNKKIKLEEGIVSTPYCESVNTNSKQIESCRNDINNNTKQIASNSSSINDLYNWVNKNIQMEYISGATSLTLQANKAYYLDGQHVADITSIDHSALKDGEKVYFYVASGDQLAHIVFRRQGLCNQNVRVWLPRGQDFWITGNDNGDTIFTLMKIGDAMRFLS